MLALRMLALKRSFSLEDASLSVGLVQPASSWRALLKSAELAANFAGHNVLGELLDNHVPSPVDLHVGSAAQTSTRYWGLHFNSRLPFGDPAIVTSQGAVIVPTWPDRAGIRMRDAASFDSSLWEYFSEEDVHSLTARGTPHGRKTFVGGTSQGPWLVAAWRQSESSWCHWLRCIDLGAMCSLESACDPIFGYSLSQLPKDGPHESLPSRYWACERARYASATVDRYMCPQLSFGVRLPSTLSAISDYVASNCASDFLRPGYVCVYNLSSGQQDRPIQWRDPLRPRPSLDWYPISELRTDGEYLFLNMGPPKGVASVHTVTKQVIWCWPRMLIHFGQRRRAGSTASTFDLELPPGTSEARLKRTSAHVRARLCSIGMSRPCLRA